MPPDPPGAPETNIAVRQSQEKLKRCKVWWSLAQQSGWTGLHQLIPCKKGYGWWQCLQCSRSFCKWKYAVTSHCPKNLGSTKGKAPSQERCVKMANKWWAQAQTQCTAEQQKCQELLNNWSFLNNQERLRRETKARSRPQLFGGIPAVPPEPTHSRVWWSCHLCDFQVVEGRQKSSSQARRQHLQKVHGFDTIPPLSRKGLSNFPSVQASVFVVQKRWRQQLEIFKQRAWAGAHVLEPDPSYVHMLTSSNGRTYQVPYFRCQQCQKTISSGDMPGSLCRSHPHFAKAPAFARRKTIWRQCRKIASKEVTKSKAKAKRKGFSGFAGVRVGEASHPGPDLYHMPKHLRLATWNCQSLRKHVAEILQIAEEDSLSLICLQEAGITPKQFPALANLCQRSGWQLAYVPASQVVDGGRGGVALLAKEPLALVTTHTSNETWGQLLVCEVLGHQVIGVPALILLDGGSCKSPQ